ncbi:MAG TPA: peptidase U32 family protein [Candidatus Cloacimonadota bacterium]|nr:peptidase U32 family protein [Candidatus Cloacimonadota bacterium]HPT70811.1 peptidase U32 family protein [Candidatus Cloacimonadota bacterium]
MNKDTKPTPELLLPAGSREAFAAAIEGGADAIYLGLEKFNARNRAKNFHAEDLPVLLDIAHKHKVKVYLTLNTLLKNIELKPFLELVQFLSTCNPDAIIVQDWGAFHFLRQMLKTQIHGSTQMGMHNSQGVQFGQKTGLTRIILARELTMPELQEIQKKSPIELEMFTHGALCYSFSGGCLFSSYSGGMSANRGLCRQPCRRLYSEEDTSKYWFNLKDLQLLEMIPQLLKLGVHSFKIEGRMKRADYVYSVARAYRLAIDHPERMQEARAILDHALNRETTAYFMQNPIIENIADFPFTGKLIGKVLRAEKEQVEIELSQPIHKGDVIRILPLSGEDRPAVSIREMKRNGQSVTSSNAGENVSISMDGKGIETGEMVFLTDKAVFKPSIQIPYRKPIRLKPLTPQNRNILDKSTKAREMEAKSGLYVRINDEKWLETLASVKVQEIWIPLSLAVSMKQWEKQGAFRIELPRFIPEKQVEEVEIAIQKLVAKGMNRFIISHISQVQFFRNMKNISVWANEWVYSLNDAAINFYADMQIRGYVYPLENDIPNLFQYRNKNGIVPLFFHPQLFYSRQPVHLKREFSDKDREYRIVRQHGWTTVLPAVPVSVFQFRDKLEERGYSRFLIDLSFMDQEEGFLDELIQAYYRGLKWKNATAFNYKKGLW